MNPLQADGHLPGENVDVTIFRVLPAYVEPRDIA
jgi:hypothetical protein